MQARRGLSDFVLEALEPRLLLSVSDPVSSLSDQSGGAESEVRIEVLTSDFDTGDRTLDGTATDSDFFEYAPSDDGGGGLLDQSGTDNALETPENESDPAALLEQDLTPAGLVENEAEAPPNAPGIAPLDVAAEDDLSLLVTANPLAESSTILQLTESLVSANGPPESASASGPELFESEDEPNLMAASLPGEPPPSCLGATIPWSELGRGPPPDDRVSSALIERDSLYYKGLSLSDSPHGEEGRGGDVQYLQVSESLSDFGGPARPADGALNEQNLRAVLDEALWLWAAAGLPADVAGRLADIEVRIADLPAGQLGWTDGQLITLDATAAGRGWFVDPTPGEHSEFTQSLGDSRTAVDAGSPAFGRMDLLTVLMHEVGHVVGFGHDSGLMVMGERLGSSERLLLADDMAVLVATPVLGSVAFDGGVTNTITADATDPPPEVPDF